LSIHKFFKFFHISLKGDILIQSHSPYNIVKFYLFVLLELRITTKYSA